MVEEAQKDILFNSRKGMSGAPIHKRNKPIYQILLSRQEHNMKKIIINAMCGNNNIV